MRLSKLLSDAPAGATMQVDGFLDGRVLKWGKHKKVKVGNVIRNFHCRACRAHRDFKSGEELSCLGLGDNQISIDVTLQCVGCRSSVEIWFLIGSSGDVSGVAPEVRIERYMVNLRDRADRVGSHRGPFSDLVKRSQIAYENQLGAGSIVYLRTIFERITFEVAEIAKIETKKPNGKKRPFYDVLKEVNEARKIIPQRFSSNGYKLFSELSKVIHGESSEEEALQKYKPCRELVLGVVNEVNRDNEYARAIEELGWNVENLSAITDEGIS
ncbi:hypothetical protein L0U85_02365 [Glycomyces sp. L485]|uniref:hypothetical protein n=1 Tax=Glycomyces sp. L485 TaxID=2909235 RepID=UPI001F4B5242|nr:hypothetical protein [Glycomyces sp. L485]MCH7229709.1 hypothetical protein [Glycomyces sp. L485]